MADTPLIATCSDSAFFCVPEGADYVLDVTVKDDAGSPVDLTGYSARVVFSTGDARENFQDLSGAQGGPENGIEFNADPLTGRFAVKIAAADTYGWPVSKMFPGLGVCHLINPSGDAQEILRASVTLHRTPIPAP